MRNRSLMGLAVFLCGCLLFAPIAVAVPVDLELQLLVDVSGSIDDAEFDTQRDGYEAAFRNAGIIDLIESGDIGAIAAQFIYWSGDTDQQIAVDWTLIDDSASSNDFADDIAAAPRPFFANTAIGSAMNFGYPLFDNNGYEGTFLVMDVSGDGITNEGDDTPDARDAALAAGVDAINGLVVGNGFVTPFYQDNVIGGTNADGTPAFVIQVDSFNDFAPAVLDKLTEIGGGQVPEPSTMLLLGTALVGLAGFRRKFRK